MFPEFGLGFAVAGIAALLFCRLAIFAGMWDMPTQARQAHRNPTPTSGGLGIGLGFAAGLIVLCLLPEAAWREALTHGELRRLGFGVGAAFLYLIIGFADDFLTLGPRMKFGVFIFASVLSAAAIGPAQALPLGAGVELEFGYVVGLIGSGLWVFTLVNCVNFMDGANGLAMGSVAIGLLALTAIAAAAGAPAAVVLAVCGAGALCGFLYWNFPNGRLFAGDSGALFAGALAAGASLVAIREGGVSPFVPPILFFPLLADALLTLGWRARMGRKLLIGHSEHLYQIGLRAGLSHSQVALAYWAASAHCGAVGFLTSEAWRGGMHAEAGAQTAAMSAAAQTLTFMPAVALATLAVVALMISNGARRFAAARGLDKPAEKKPEPAPETAA